MLSMEYMKKTGILTYCKLNKIQQWEVAAKNVNANLKLDNRSILSQKKNILFSNVFTYEHNR